MLMTMLRWKYLMGSLVCLVSVFLQSGCSYYALDGGEKLNYDEARPLMPVYSPEEVEESMVFALRGRKMPKNPAKGGYESMVYNGRPSMNIVTLRSIFTFLLMGTAWGESDAYATPKEPEHATPSVHHGYNVISFLVGFFVNRDGINPETTRVRTTQTMYALPLIPLLYFYDNRVAPEGTLINPIVGANPAPTYRDIFSREPLETVRFERRYSHTLLLGAVGWGVKDHNRFFQLFWIPFKTGEVEYEKSGE